MITLRRRRRLKRAYKYRHSVSRILSMMSLIFCFQDACGKGWAACSSRIIFSFFTFDDCQYCANEVVDYGVKSNLTSVWASQVIPMSARNSSYNDTASRYNIPRLSISHKGSSDSSEAFLKRVDFWARTLYINRGAAYCHSPCKAYVNGLPVKLAT